MFRNLVLCLFLSAASATGIPSEIRTLCVCTVSDVDTVDLYCGPAVGMINGDTLNFIYKDDESYAVRSKKVNEIIFTKNCKETGAEKERRASDLVLPFITTVCPPPSNLQLHCTEDYDVMRGLTEECQAYFTSVPILCLEDLDIRIGDLHIPLREICPEGSLPDCLDPVWPISTIPSFTIPRYPSWDGLEYELLMENKRPLSNYQLLIGSLSGVYKPSLSGNIGNTGSGSLSGGSSLSGLSDFSSFVG